VTYLRLDQAHELLKSRQVIVEDDVALTVDGQKAQHTDRASRGCSHEVLDLADAIPRQAHSHTSIAGGFDVLI
jgi:hypothetical protein